MNCELNGMKIKYEDGKVWMWREMWRKHKLKVPKWYEMKGTILFNGYRNVTINTKRYYYHRVVYFIHNQEWDIHNSSTDNSIDHIDRDRLNNSIENLRVVTNQQNAWNRDGKGYYHTSSGNYQAKLHADGEHIHLGMFENPEDARQAYLEGKKKYHPM